MNLLPGLILLALVLLFFALPIAANLYRHRHHDHLITGHPRAPR